METFESEKRKIIWGDVFEGLKTVPNGSVDLIFIDPPYNIGKNFGNSKDKWPSEEKYLEWAYQWLDLCIEKLTPCGSLYFMAATQYMPFFDLYLRRKMTILSRIIWNYDSSGVQAKNYYGSLYEPILFCVKDKNHYVFNANEIMVEAKTGAQRKLIDYRKTIPAPYHTQKVPGNVWNFPRVRFRMEEYECHPSQKPMTLLERIVRASSCEGDLVLDPFSGTFTTSYVAWKCGRRSVGIELQEEYVKIGLRRLEIAQEYKGELLTKKRSFSQKVKTETKKQTKRENCQYESTLF